MLAVGGFLEVKEIHNPGAHPDSLSGKRLFFSPFMTIFMISTMLCLVSYHRRLA